MLDIKRVLKEKGMSVQDLADAFGKTRQTISTYINNNPTLETLEKVASIIGVTVPELFFEDKKPATCPHCGKQLDIEVKKATSQPPKT